MKEKRTNQICEICKEKPSEHIHHKDENHKNNAVENLQHVCTLCHSKIHNIEPRYSEIRKLITFYSRTQKARCAIENQIRGLSRIELEIPEYFNQLLLQIGKQEKLYSKEIKKLLENGNEDHLKYDIQYSFVSFPIYSWLKNIKGISHLLAGKLIALIDIEKTPMVSSLWCYAGQTPNSKKVKGQKANWNQELKKVCYQISDSFVKQRTPKYREIYDKEKVKQLILLDDATLIVKPTIYLQNPKQEEKIKNAVKTIYELSSPPKSKMHAERRARRKAVKEFLKDLWIEMNELNNKEEVSCPS